MTELQKAIIAATLAITGTYLLYDNTIGINYLLFSSVSAISAIAIHNKASTQNKLIAILPSILSSFSLMLFPQQISLYIWMISYFSMWILLANPLKPLLIPLQSLIAIFESPKNQISFFKKITNSEKAQDWKSKFYIAFITFLICLIFITLYSSGNAIFASYLSMIELPSLNFGLIINCLILFVIIFGLAESRVNESLKKYNGKKQHLEKSNINPKDEKEFSIAKASIWSITVILLLVNALDLITISTKKLPEGMSFSSYVHEGFYTLIIAICLAIGMILYFYRNRLNFHQKVKHLRLACNMWILQNIALAFITCYKNLIYVEAYGLTYKRVAVFLFLLCTLIGLTLSLWKIKKPYTNWLYFNRTVAYAFLFGIFTSLIPFDKAITFYNLEYSQTKDIDYLLSLKNPDYHAISNYLNNKNEKNYIVYDITRYRIKELEQQANNNSWKEWNLHINQYATK
ncbi:DUF4153 domain-containing protein [Aureibacter tunicatorum]|uniref:DUF4173 domain-containing protein n=1 Tax=Aureibacter tunicatorum TaxID=866807 RepID=A0AAE3XPG7_9BACT|nr:DUF4173 domain-containing protein [Aureibacter tunicatorum]MDR6239551.1 hypothetical protein [Aureibacter tunicatorum]BDD04028.1 hypothetical protein AUTU_15110 [Aureibacter tunicatorum]